MKQPKYRTQLDDCDDYIECFRVMYIKDDKLRMTSDFVVVRGGAHSYVSPDLVDVFNEEEGVWERYL